MDNAIVHFDETEKTAAAMVKSGFFTDVKDASQAIVKIMAGREMGFGAFASMTGVYIIQGRPSVGANLMASAVKRHPRYDYRVLEMTDKVCTLEYYQDGKPIGQSTFTIEDARKAGTKNLDKYPRNMLFARAMSNGVRWYCPDVFDGAAVYTPEELGADVNESGDVINYTPPTVTVYPPGPPAQDQPPTTMTLNEALAVTNSEGEPYGSLDSDKLGHMARAISKKLDGSLSDELRQEYQRKADAIKLIVDSRHGG